MGIIRLNGTEYAGSGGSGGHTIVDPTGTDMPQENKLQFTGAVNVSDDAVNGQTVVDIEGGGNYYLNTIYSTEEKKVGYWTDNKPLYQKTWFVPKSSLNSGETTYTHGDDLHIDNLVSVEGAVGNSRPLVEYHSSSAWACSIYNIGNNAFWIYLGSNVYSNMSASSYVKVTLRYTKTTDTAEPNPQTGGVIYLPTIYSEEEREVGVWRDGKPLYQKTIDIAPLPNRTTKEIQLDADIERVISMHGYGIDANDKWDVFLNDVVPTNVSGSVRVFFNTSTKKLYINTGENLTSYTEAYVTIQYTKTTDTAGSGNWNTDGVPTHHYSTNEQVIGTWIDGKPLYEKTIVYTPSEAITSSVTIATIANAKVMRVTEATGYNATDNRGYDLPDVLSSGGTKFSYDNGDVVIQTFNDSWNSGWTFYVTVQYTKTTD